MAAPEDAGHRCAPISGEISEAAVVRESRIAASDGKRCLTKLFNVDAVNSVGCRVNDRLAA